MDVSRLAEVADQTLLAVTLAVDPSADDPERYVAWVGLDAFGAGSTPDAALSKALRRLPEGMHNTTRQMVTTG